MFFDIDKRILYIIIAILVLFGISSYITNPNEIYRLLYVLPGVLIAITFHEFAHAKTADILGDDTPARQGRITLNPLAHIDIVGFIMLMVAGFGWGKPVNVNERNYNRDITITKANAIVSIAGPLANFILAIIFTIIYFLVFKFVKMPSKGLIIIMQMIAYTIQINIGLGVFNLIPLPPLDGSKVIKPFLNYNTKVWFEDNERIFYMIFIVLWITGIAGIIISPIIQFLNRGLFEIIGFLFKM